MVMRTHQVKFCSLIFVGSVLEILRDRVLALSSDQDLASTGTHSETVALEVVGSTLHVDTVRGEPRTWFASIKAAPTTSSVSETNTR